MMWVILAVFGGVARYLDAYIRGTATISFGLLVAHSFVSGFSGYMVAQTVLLFTDPKSGWAFVAAGIGGYLGTQGLDWVAAILKTKFGPPGSPSP